MNYNLLTDYILTFYGLLTSLGLLVGSLLYTLIRYNYIKLPSYNIDSPSANIGEPSDNIESSSDTIVPSSNNIESIITDDDSESETDSDSKDTIDSQSTVDVNLSDLYYVPNVDLNENSIH